MTRTFSMSVVAAAVAALTIASTTLASAQSRHHQRQLRDYGAVRGQVVEPGFFPGSRAYERGWRGPAYNGYGPGEYDRRVNGSDASTPGHN